MNVDRFFTIGKTHTICQDYARVEPARGDAGPWIVLSDGCSTAKDSDFGSRILVRSALSALRDGGFTLPGVIAEARTVARAQQLDQSCLNATLLWAHRSGGNIHVGVAGDGFVVARRRDRSGFEIRQIEYPSGAPFYLSYLLNSARRADYERTYGTLVRDRYWSRGAWSVVNEWEGDLDREISFNFDVETYDLVALCSDGLASFQKPMAGTSSKVFESVPIEDVAAQVIDVPTYDGEFAVRTCRWLFNKHCPKVGWHNDDDFSAAMIYAGQVP